MILINISRLLDFKFEKRPATSLFIYLSLDDYKRKWDGDKLFLYREVYKNKKTAKVRIVIKNYFIRNTENGVAIEDYVFYHRITLAEVEQNLYRG